ncbi:MAG: DUF2997 domain-containing protein [bacterium JZ-2024 1]
MRVIVKIDKLGNARVEVDGVAGPMCREITKRLEEALGEESAVEYKPEYFSVVSDGGVYESQGSG